MPTMRPKWDSKARVALTESLDKLEASLKKDDARGYTRRLKAKLDEAPLVERLKHHLRWALSVIEHEVPCPDCGEYITRCLCDRDGSSFARHYDASAELVKS